MSAEPKARRSKFDIPPDALTSGAPSFIPASGGLSWNIPPASSTSAQTVPSRFMQDIAEAKGMEEQIYFQRPTGITGNNSYAPPISALPDVTSIINSFAPAPLVVSARDPAFRQRLDKAMSKNLAYIVKKDAGLLTKPASVPAAPKVNAAAYNEQAKQKSGIGAPVVIQAITQQQVSANAAWDQRCSAYVSGLPKDFTEKELDILFSKIGAIRKVRLYRDASGNKKGDGLVTYTKPESVAVACSQLNRLDIGEGYVLWVSPADYSQGSNKSSSVSSNSPSVAAATAPKESAVLHAPASSSSESTLHTRPMSMLKLPLECEWDKYPVVIVANVFTASNTAQEGAQFLKELEMDMLVEFCKYGTVRRVVVSHPQLPTGTVTAAFSCETEAKRCADALEGRRFDGNRLSTSISVPMTPPLLSQPLSLDDSSAVGATAETENAVDVEKIAENVEDFLNSLM